ncbi:TonB-dependent receptor [Mucilaginibacter sp. HC2]|uniref:SusC/RagA family TonB-linked outer membrane protein n=1 Tax=Mucilaginibacter inviolabilis TaxID=2714892 RepID=UPI00140E6E6C|nr:TonB-dependent receptor [Mucilaginibacter inviolabilis]NHA03948.1 TonB-dependent receptor [Mucilaginibacter inviolabilis]
MKHKLLKLFMVCFFCSASMAFAQNRTITGTVTSKEDGLPIPGASVKIKGTNTGGQTNLNGKYTISAPAGSTLVFSFIGYTSRDIAIEGKTNIDVVLSADSKALAEVVITGYLSQEKGKSAISSSLVKSKDIQDVPLTNINDVLQGKAAGVTVMSTSGQPGASSDVRIRGVGSISASSSPIYVVDGIIVERGQFAIDGAQVAGTNSNDILSNMNPNDIESVTVLKDASALALYGSRGANGVIVITTKRGKAGESTIDFSAQAGTVRPSFGKFGLMSGAQTYNYERSVLALNGTSQADIDAQYPASMLNKTFDWLDAAFKHGSTQTYDLGIRGGTDKTTHSLSLGYFKQDGTVPNSNFERFTSNLNVDSKPRTWLKVGLSFNTSFSNQKDADAGNLYSSPILSAFVNSPLHVYPYKPDGSLYTGQEPDYGGFSGDNFLYSNALNYTKVKQFRGLGKGYADIKITPWLSAKQTVGIDLIQAAVKTYFDPTTGNGIGATPATSGELIQTQNNTYTFTSQSSLYGQASSKDKRHQFDYLVLTEYQRYNSSFILADGKGSANPKLQELGTFGTPNAVGGGQSEYSFLSYLGQLNYTFDNKYTLTSSIRRDGSSRFSADNRYANFYSFGASWKIIDEAFMKNQTIFSDLRLRSSYGTSGVATFPVDPVTGLPNNYLAQPLYTYSGITYNGTAGSAPSTPGNPVLTWEKSRQFDVGLETGFFDGRLRATLDYYNKKSTSALLSVPVSRTSGFTSTFRNIAAIENKGYEATLSSDNFKSKNGFNWTTDFNFSYNKNVVTGLFNNQDIAGGTLGRTSVGQPLNSWFLPVWAGVDPKNGDPLWYLADGKTTTNSYTIASRTENRKFVGSSIPKFNFGMGNTFRYQGFDFSFFVYAVTGAKVYDQTLSYLDSDGQRWQWAYYKDADKDYWTTPGQIAERPKPSPNGNKNSSNPSTRYLESGNYLRLRTVSLGYSLPSDIAHRLQLSSLRFFVTGVNLITITSYKGVDPENALNGNDVFKYPSSKSVTAGIKVSLL